MYSLRIHNVFAGWRFIYGCVCTVAVIVAYKSFTLSVFLTKPTNTVSFVGERVRIECSSNPSDLLVDWEFARAGSNSFSYIYTGERITESLTSRYKMDTDGKTRYDIVIDSVDLSHAGRYRCTPVTGQLLSATASLTVLGIGFKS